MAAGNTVINFYMDDSGARHPDRDAGRASVARDFFALGGILIDEDDEKVTRELHAEFCEAWGIDYPLHSVDIRHRAKDFSWLQRMEEGGYERFLAELETFLLQVPAYALACVINRPGYNKRYRKMYAPRNRWLLCKTAFTIAVERAAKFAIDRDARLRVLPERCDKTADRKLKGYYDGLKAVGSPFNPDTSAPYRPLTAQTYSGVLYDFHTKYKSSPMAQLADLYLWPLCMRRYLPNYRPLQKLIEAGKLIECLYPAEEANERGTKYSCYDG